MESNHAHTHNYHAAPDHIICDSLQQETPNLVLFMNATAALSKVAMELFSRVWYDDNKSKKPSTTTTTTFTYF